MSREYIFINRPDLVIFDMDGTIFDSERINFEAKYDVAGQYGYDLKLDDYIRTLGTYGIEENNIVRGIYGEEYPAETINIKARSEVINRIRSAGMPVKPGVIQTLHYLKERGIRCCIATSSPSENARVYLSHALIDDEVRDISGFFEFIISGDDITYSKPDPEIFISACKKANVDPENALVIEDSDNGVLAASNAGITVICVPDLKDLSPEIAALTDAVIQSLEMLKIEKA